MGAFSLIVVINLLNRFDVEMSITCFRHFSKRFCSSTIRGAGAITDHPWLSQPLEGDSASAVVSKESDRKARNNASQQKTQVTRLSNGVRVATHPSRGEFCTVGVGIEAGSRYEMFSPAGVTHFLEKMAFSSTQKYSSKDNILNTLAQHSGICDCQYARDVAFYALSIASEHVDVGVDILSQSVLHPNITAEEVDRARNLVHFDLLDQEESLARMQPDLVLHDLIHRASFRGNTIGLPRFCPQEHLETIQRGDLTSYMSTYFVPERTVVTGVGVDHDYLCKLVEGGFDFKKASFLQDGKLLEVDRSVAQYTGGEIKIDKQLTPVTGGENPLPELSHMMIGLESVGSQHEDYVPTTVLSFLMGGGGSFSAGGPGKGMYSRMYLNVLNRNYYVQHASVLNFPYADCGLFAIQLACEPDRVRETLTVGVKECLNMVQSEVTSEELKRAKNQLKAIMFANLEAKPVQMEDIARQILSQGFKREPTEVCEMIESVTKQDITRVADRLLGSKISVAALGQLNQMPAVRDITQAFINNGILPQTESKSLFNRR